MKRLTLFAILVLTPALARSSSAEDVPGGGVSFAEPPPPVAVVPPPEAAPSAKPSPTEVATTKLVRAALLEPLAEKDSATSKFSRARMPPRERRVRVVDAAPVRDARGRRFVRFAIDERRGVVLEGPGEGWELGVITGCAYLERRELFVQHGDELRPAELLLGKYRKAAPAATCHDGAVAHALKD
jgi:hypothetical protein